jgi:hypothetical protein
VSDLSGVRVERKLVKIPVAGVPSGWSANPSSPARSGFLYADVEYVNGWAVTVTSAQAAAGASSFAAAGALGLAPGLRLTIADGANTESVTVGPSYAAGALTVPTVTPLAFAHDAGVAVSALPGAVKDAVILLTSSRIKLRGAEAVQMGSITSEPSAPQPTMPGGTTELAQAKDLLLRFRRAR